MSLKGILSISGTGGLFKVVAQTKSGFIVENMLDEKRIPVSSTQKISMLEDISVYTTAGDIPLREVFQKLKEHESEAVGISPKADNNTIREFFLKVMPEYDANRVYVSDIQKMLKWFQMLHEKVTFEEAVADEEESGASDASVAVAADETSTAVTGETVATGDEASAADEATKTSDDSTATDTK